MSSTELHALFGEFAQRLGLEGFELNPDEPGYLTFDDIIVSLHFDEAREHLTIHAPLTELPERNREAKLMHLLQANLFWGRTAGCTLALSAGTGQVILQDRIRLESRSAEGLALRFARFLDQCEHWTERLQANDDSYDSTDEVREMMNDLPV